LNPIHCPHSSFLLQLHLPAILALESTPRSFLTSSTARQ
jgi:hypothetical protein